MAWTDAAAAGLEALWQQEHAQCCQLEGQVREALKDLRKFCAEAGNTQKANNKALKELHRELGQLAAAANQQKLTALLIESDGRINDGEAPGARPARRKNGAVSAAAVSRSRAPASGDGGSDLRSTIERARARGNRFNAARIEAWITELEQAIRLGEHAMVNRGLAGLAAELAK